MIWYEYGQIHWIYLRYIFFHSLQVKKKMAQLFILVSFVLPISPSSRKRKSLFLSFHDMWWRIWPFPLKLPSLYLFHLFRIKRCSCYFCFACFFTLKKQKISISFVSWYGMKNMVISIESIFVTFVSLVSGKTMGQISFSLLLFRLFLILQKKKSSVSFRWFLSFHVIAWRISALPSLHLFYLFRVKRWHRCFSHYFCFAYFFILQKKENLCFFRFMLWDEEYGFSIESTFVTFVSLVSGKKTAQIFFFSFHDMGWRISAFPLNLPSLHL